MRNNVRIIAVACSVTVACSLAACSGQHAGTAGQASAPAGQSVVLDQAQLCVTIAIGTKPVTTAGTQCAPGQKVLFQPMSWGNEQLPVMFASANCDLRYSVVITNGAVTCIYHPLAPIVLADNSAPASASSTKP